MNGKQTYIHAGKPPIYIIFLKKLHFPAETAEIQAGEVVQVCNPNTGGGGADFWNSTYIQPCRQSTETHKIKQFFNKKVQD